MQVDQLTGVEYADCPLLDNIEPEARLIRGIIPMQLHEDAAPIAKEKESQSIIGYSYGGIKRFGLELELEAHDPDSTRLLKNFALNICGCTDWWDQDAFVHHAIDEIRAAAGDGNALCIMTGGLYSNVTAMLAARALGSRLICVFIDTGFLQEDRESWFADFFTEKTGLPIIKKDHRERFLQALKGIRGFMEKKRTIESIMTIIRRDEQRNVPQLNAVIRGRSYMERLTEGEEVNGLRAGVLCVEPLRDLFMEEVCQIGEYLGLPEDLVSRQAIPATGLALNVIGEVNEDKLSILRCADGIFRHMMEERNQTRRLSAYFAELSQTPGGYTITLKAHTSSDTGISRAARVPYDILEDCMQEIMTECPIVHHVVYDLTSVQDI